MCSDHSDLGLNRLLHKPSHLGHFWPGLLIERKKKKKPLYTYIPSTQSRLKFSSIKFIQMYFYLKEAKAWNNRRRDFYTNQTWMGKWPRNLAKKFKKLMVVIFNFSSVNFLRCRVEVVSYVKKVILEFFCIQKQHN